MPGLTAAPEVAHYGAIPHFMTDKQFLAITANMHGQSVYQQQTIGHLVGLVHGLSKAICVLARAQGLDEAEILKAFSSGTREMTRTASEKGIMPMISRLAIVKGAGSFAIRFQAVKAMAAIINAVVRIPVEMTQNIKNLMAMRRLCALPTWCHAIFSNNPVHHDPDLGQVVETAGQPCGQ